MFNPLKLIPTKTEIANAKLLVRQQAFITTSLFNMKDQLKHNNIKEMYLGYQHIKDMLTMNDKVTYISEINDAIESIPYTLR